MSEQQNCQPNRGARRRAKCLGVLLAAAATAGGCNSYQESQWFFAAAQVPVGHVEPGRIVTADAVKVDDVKLKFYRVTIKGWSINSNAELLTGVYPVKPLHDLFGEVTRPEEKKKDNVDDADAAAPATKSTTSVRKEVIGDGRRDATPSEPDQDVMLFECNKELGRLRLIPQDARFTIFYGANADAIADQVKQFADADDTGTLMARLLLSASGAGEQKLAADAADKTSANLSKALSDEIPSELEKQAATIKPTDAEAARTSQVNAALASVSQAILKSLGSTSTVDPKDVNWGEKVQAAANALRGTGGGQ